MSSDDPLSLAFYTCHYIYVPLFIQVTVDAPLLCVDHLCDVMTQWHKYSTWWISLCPNYKKVCLASWLLFQILWQLQFHKVSFDIVFTFISCSISTLFWYICVFYACISIESSRLSLVSVILFAYTVFSPASALLNWSSLWICGTDHLVHLVCLLQISSWLSSSHFRDNLLLICCCTLYVFILVFAHPVLVTLNFLLQPSWSSVLSSYHPICPWFTIFSLHCYSEPCR